MSSLKGRLTAWLLVGLAVLLVGGGWVLRRSLSARLLGDFDDALIAETRSLRALTLKRGGVVAFDFADEVMPEFSTTKDPAYFQLWRTDGAVLERSRSLKGGNLPRLGDLSDRPRLLDLKLPDGRNGRLVEVSFHPRLEEDEGGPIRGDDPRDLGRFAEGDRMVLAVARGRDRLDASLAALDAPLALVIAGLLGGSVLLVLTSLRAGFAPLAQVERQIEAIDAGSLGARIDIADPPRELRSAIGRLNGLLRRLETSFERERAFSANLAHELRTPLAELRAVADVALELPRDSGQTEAFFADVRAIGLQMERILATLLALAHYDGGPPVLKIADFDLGTALLASSQTVATEAAARGIHFEFDVPSVLGVRTDPGKLHLALVNLFANAVAHGATSEPGGGWLRCRAERSGDRFLIRIENPVQRLAASDLPRMFDRFWRLDSARTGGTHAGLGLPLVAAICVALGIEIETTLVDGVFSVQLRGPADSAHLPHICLEL